MRSLEEKKKERGKERDDPPNSQHAIMKGDDEKMEKGLGSVYRIEASPVREGEGGRKETRFRSRRHRVLRKEREGGKRGRD